MNIKFYDFETTGLPIYEIPSGDPSQPHIVQIGAILADEKTGEAQASLDVIVKPDGWTIPDEVAAIHGITTEMAMDVGIPEKEAVQMLLDMWRKCGMRVAHNESFDARIMRIALKRYFSDELADEFKAAPKACTGLLAKPIMQMPPKGRYGWKMPKLTEAYEHFTGKTLENAHSAMADTLACKEVYYAIVGGEKPEGAA